ncbi:MAG: hypothetical protein AAF219_04700 [Myxococcota bacterium]
MSNVIYRLLAEIQAEGYTILRKDIPDPGGEVFSAFGVSPPVLVAGKALGFALPLAALNPSQNSCTPTFKLAKYENRDRRQRSSPTSV